MKNPTIFSKEIPSRSFRVKSTIGSLVICAAPILCFVYVGPEAYSFFNASTIVGYVVVGIWFAAELALIRWLYVSREVPKYVYECFQLNLLFSNLWFLWVGLIGLSLNA